MGAVPLRPGGADGRPSPPACCWPSTGSPAPSTTASRPLAGRAWCILLAGAVAAGSAVVAKWLLVGRIRPASTRSGVPSSGGTRWWTPSSRWSAPRGSPARPPGPRPWSGGSGPWAQRSARGTWCESYWLPEADLVTLGRNSTVNRGCVVQTHLFHDRVMSIDTVTLEDGATMGPHGVILPAGTDRQRRHGGPGVPGHAGRNGSGRDVLDGQPGEPLERPGECLPPSPSSPAAPSCPPAT